MSDSKTLSNDFSFENLPEGTYLYNILTDSLHPIGAEYACHEPHQDIVRSSKWLSEQLHPWIRFELYLRKYNEESPFYVSELHFFCHRKGDFILAVQGEMNGKLPNIGDNVVKIVHDHFNLPYKPNKGDAQ